MQGDQNNRSKQELITAGNWEDGQDIAHSIREPPTAQYSWIVKMDENDSCNTLEYAEKNHDNENGAENCWKEEEEEG